MSPVETLLADVLAAHYYQWGGAVCSCSTHMPVHLHRAHVTAEQAKALQAWLLTNDTIDTESRHTATQAWHDGTDDIRAILTTIADLIGGTP